MAKDQKDKTLSYHRAEYLIGQPDSIKLGSCLIEAVAKLVKMDDKSIPRSGGRWTRLAKHKIDDAKGIFLHLTTDTPGEEASVVPKIRPDAAEIQVSTAAPPANQEFMDGDAFIYVKGNDVCLCSTGMHIKSVQFFLQRFLMSAAIRKDAGNFDLLNALTAKALSLLHQHGVSEIELRGSFYSATADYAKRKAQPVWALAAASKHLKAVLGKPHDVTPDALQVSLKLKVDGRHAGTHLGQQRINSLAETVLSSEETDDNYIITLNNGEMIKPDEVYVRSSVRINSKGKSVDREDAWTKLKGYFNMLVSTGVMSQ